MSRMPSTSKSASVLDLPLNRGSARLRIGPPAGYPRLLFRAARILGTMPPRRITCGRAVLTAVRRIPWSVLFYRAHAPLLAQIASAPAGSMKSASILVSVKMAPGANSRPHSEMFSATVSADASRLP